MNIAQKLVSIWLLIATPFWVFMAMLVLAISEQGYGSLESIVVGVVFLVLAALSVLSISFDIAFKLYIGLSVAGALFIVTLFLHAPQYAPLTTIPYWFSGIWCTIASFALLIRLKAAEKNKVKPCAP